MSTESPIYPSTSTSNDEDEVIIDVDDDDASSIASSKPICVMRPSASFHDDPSDKKGAVMRCDSKHSQTESVANTRPRLKLFVAALTLAIGVALLKIGASISSHATRGGGSHGDPNDPWDAKWPFIEPPYASGQTCEIIARGKMGNVYTLTFSEQDLHCKQTYEVMEGESACNYSILLGDTKFHDSTEEEEEGMLILYQTSTTSGFAPAFARTFLDDFPREMVLLLGKDGEDNNNNNDNHKYRLTLMAINPDSDDSVASRQQDYLEKYGMSMGISSQAGGTAAFYSGVGNDPFKLIAEGVGMVIHPSVLSSFLIDSSDDLTTNFFKSLVLGGMSTQESGPLQSFQTDAEITTGGYEMAKLHAIALSISGDRIHFDDKPNTSNTTFIQEVVCEDGTTLPCSRTGLPIESALLRDPQSFGPLVVQNTNGVPGGQITSGVLGVFNFAPSSDVASATATVSIHPSDIHNFGPFPKRTPFLAYSHGSKQARVLRSADESFDMNAPLDSVWSDVITIVPIAKLAQVYGSLAHYQVAPLGLLGKFNSGGAILQREHNDKTAAATTRLLVRGCGEFSVLVRMMTSNGIFQKMPDAVETVRVGEKLVSHKELSLVDLDDDTAPILGVGGKGFNLVQFNVTCTGKEQWVTVDLVV